jgi:sugar lactone lactonase YvrE
VTDTGNNTIRKIIIATGEVSTLAGTTASFRGPFGITTDGTNLYVADTGNDTIRKIVIATGTVTTLAGTAGSPGSVDGTGANASFNGPYGITTDGTNLYLADTGNNIIRKIQ